MTKHINFASYEPLNIKPCMMYCASENDFWGHLEEYQMDVRIGSDAVVFVDTNAMYKGPIHLSRNDIRERRRDALGEADIYTSTSKIK